MPYYPQEQLRESQKSFANLQRDTAHLAREHSNASHETGRRHEAEAELRRLREQVATLEQAQQARNDHRTPRRSQEENIEARTREARLDYLEEELRRKDDLLVDARRRLQSAEDRSSAAEGRAAAAVDAQHTLSQDVSRLRDALATQATELSALRARESDAARRQAGVQKQTERLLQEMASWASANGSGQQVFAENVSRLVSGAVVAASPVSPRMALKLRRENTDREREGSVEVKEREREYNNASLSPRGGERDREREREREREELARGAGVKEASAVMSTSAFDAGYTTRGSPLFTPSSKRPLIGGIIA